MGGGQFTPGWFLQKFYLAECYSFLWYCHWISFASDASDTDSIIMSTSVFFATALSTELYKVMKRVFFAADVNGYETRT